MRKYCGLIICILFLLSSCTAAKTAGTNGGEVMSDLTPMASSSTIIASDEASCDFDTLEDFYRYVMTPEEQWGRYTVNAEAYLPIDKLFPDEEVGGVTVVDENHYLISFVGEDGTNLSNFVFRVRYDPQYQGKALEELHTESISFAAVIDLNTAEGKKESVSDIASGKIRCVKDAQEAEISVYQGEIRACEFVCGPYLLKFSNLGNLVETPDEAMALVTDFLAK